MDNCISAIETNGTAVVDVVDSITAEAGGIAVVNGIATEANGTAVVDGAATEDTGIATSSQIQLPKTNGTVVVDVVDSIDAEAGGIAVVNGIATEANGTAVVDGAATEDTGIATSSQIQLPETNGTVVVDVVDSIDAEAGGIAVVNGIATEDTRIATSSQIQNAWNTWESISRLMFKVGQCVFFSGVTELVNKSSLHIDFYTTAGIMEELQASLTANNSSELIKMRQFSAFKYMSAPKIVKLKVRGRGIGIYEDKTFVPQDFIIFKKLVFDANKVGKIFLSGSERR